MKSSRKKRKFIRIIVIIIGSFFGMVLSLLIILGIYLQTDAFSRFARKKAAQYVQSKTNRIVEINDISISLMPFRAVVKYFTLYGPKK